MSIVAEKIALNVDGDDWLYPFDLTLEPGSFTTVVGPTRAGKTSLLRILSGLTKPSSGRLLVDGVDMTGVNVRKRSVGMVYQEFVNYPAKTVFENIAAPLRNAGESNEAIRQRVTDVADIVGISNLLDRFPLELSGGQQQRVAIARTIARKRQLILLDEPLVNLDYKLREHLRGEFRRIFADSQTIAVYASSEPTEALVLNGDVVIMSEGHLVQHGAAEEVYRSPRNVTAARQVSEPPVSLLPASLELDGARRKWFAGDTEIGPEPVHTSALDAGDYQLGVFPHHLFTDQSATGIPAQVDFIEVSGSNTFIYARACGAMLAIKERGINDYVIDQTVHVRFDPAHMLVFDRSGALVASPNGGAANG
ncbi:ABC transporter ATP-binding protein [Nitratireductor kimnyeongensis]|uniref:ABC transporter ATP-binding protein n=1 Tax=Nitratireductor kimnyeongensis TaxID=430679 RepID=A0ABW0T6X1_9HYPH|nr:ABC transporter ATP-binding protein [Nitratireductor kimnyeongensis]QZZ36459.1 ABC transporter ATP-binding protein [Nitratireductor kimnyeongensis]